MKTLVKVLAGLCLAGISLALILPRFARVTIKPQIVHQIDWEERGLDPTSPGFKPEVVVLAGTFYTSPEEDHVPRDERGEFEIKMRGFSRYHRIEWENGKAWWWRTCIGVDQGVESLDAYRMMFRKATGTGGSRFGGPGTNGWLEVARRLWDRERFVGALPEALTMSEDGGLVHEEFKDLEQRGPYKIPRTIVYSGWPDGRTRTYTVKKIEFLSKPTGEWFIQEKEKFSR